MHHGQRRKTIAFISCAPHQSRLFSFFERALPPGTEAAIVNVNLLPLTFGFWTAALKMLISAQQPGLVTDPIIALDYRKYRVNRANVLRPIDRAVEWLWRRVAAIYVELFTARFRKKHVDLIVVWGGFQLPVAAALAAAREAGLSTLFCENGYLPRTIVLDPKGINAGNSLMGKPAAFYRAVAIEGEQRSGLFDMPLVARPLKGGSAASEKLVLPDQFVFLPLQVHDDSQILLYSPRFADMKSVIHSCAEAVAVCNERYGTRLKLVVKEHPSDFGRVNYASLYKKYPDVAFTKLASTEELIVKSSAVITVNSTVGIEAMLHLKPVITLGEAFYAVPGLVRPFAADGDLAALIHEAIETPPDRDLTEHFLYFLRYEYLVPLDRNDLAKANPQIAVEKIMKAIS